MNYHNPENLSDWGQSDGWRLLTTEEIKQPLPEDAQFWANGWESGSWKSTHHPNEIGNFKNSYRTKKPLPVSPLIAQLDAEIKAKQELREVALAVEAGAEWEIQAPEQAVISFQTWTKPDQPLEWFLSPDRACKWQVRLKPKPVTRPWRLKDVPWNCRIRGKKTENKDFWFTPFAVGLYGVYINNVGPARLVQWDELQEDWEHTTLELKGEWLPCATEEAK